MDEFEKEHLEKWLDRTIYPDEKESIRKQIENMVNEYPEMLKNRSWPEILNLCERRK